MGPDTCAAGGVGEDRSRLEEDLCESLFDCLFEDVSRCRGDYAPRARVDLMALQDLSRHKQIFVATVGRRSYECLVDRSAFHLLDSLHLVHVAGLGYFGLKLV